MNQTVPVKQHVRLNLAILVVVLLLAGSLSGRLLADNQQTSRNKSIQSFNEAKRLLHRAVYYDHRVTFYCGCEYSDDKRVDRTVCGYVPQRDNSRARRIEWEHVVPAEAFGQSFREWREGDHRCVDSKGKPFKGRRCASKANTEFRYMQADMYNLVPAIGELNAARSNYSMAVIPAEPRDYGSCDFEIADRKIEPADNIRGDVARIYLYMDAAYPGRGIVSRKNKPLFQAWSAGDPVDPWECERARRIEKQQGNANPFVKDACAAATF